MIIGNSNAPSGINESDPGKPDGGSAKVKLCDVPQARSKCHREVHQSKHHLQSPLLPMPSAQSKQLEYMKLALRALLLWRRQLAGAKSNYFPRIERKS